MTRRAQGLAISLGGHVLACWVLWRFLTPSPPSSGTMELILSPLVAAPVVSGTGDLKGKAQNLGKPSRAALSRFPPVKMNGGVDEKRVCLPPVLPVVNPAGHAIEPLENIFTRPAGIKPLPGLSTPPPTPVTPKSGTLTQLPPWMRDEPPPHNPGQNF